jgi:hypothetical protein
MDNQKDDMVKKGKPPEEMSDDEMMYRFFKLSAEIWLSKQTVKDLAASPAKPEPPKDTFEITRTTEEEGCTTIYVRRIKPVEAEEATMPPPKPRKPRAKKSAPLAE